jgi:23S rRNA G2445 N2-methylase RlmL
LKNRSLVLLSGEGTTVPLAEARALFQTYDPASRFESPHPRLLLVRSSADPFRVGQRVAFARRVGALVDGPKEAAEIVEGKKVRFRAFSLNGKGSPPEPEPFLDGLEAEVDLKSPDFEITLVRADADYLTVSSPGTMSQKWSSRRPRRRAFFHPSAIFPKLSRALFNLSRCPDGGVFLDPFSGTGSIPLEAALCGARVVAFDVTRLMARGSLSNMKNFNQDWVGVVRADSTKPPIRTIDAISTDIPYGRASSTRGREPAELLQHLLPALGDLLRPSRRLVLMHPQQLRVPQTEAFTVEEEHHLHVHKLLTRTITVLKRR